jgi:hypothetical protein
MKNYSKIIQNDIIIIISWKHNLLPFIFYSLHLEE